MRPEVAELGISELDDLRHADLLNSPLLSKVNVVGTREGGLLICWVPTELIDHEEVAVKEEWANTLAEQMRDVAARDGGNGQLSAIIVGLIPGVPKLKILDGFHRDAGLLKNHERQIFATVKLTNWNDLYDDRIFTAKDHVHVRFSRVVQWMREVWQYSGLSSDMTIEQAVLLYRFDSSGSRLGIDPEKVAAAKEWVRRKEDKWKMAAMTIHGHLMIAASVDPALVHSTREKTDGHVLEAPTQAILKIFSEQIPNNFTLQNMVMAAAMQHNLKGPEVNSLCIAVKNCAETEAAQTVIDNIDWTTWRPAYSETKNRALRRAYDPRYKGAMVFKRAIAEVENISARVENIISHGEQVDVEMQSRLREANESARLLISALGKVSAKLANIAGEEIEAENVIRLPETAIVRVAEEEITERPKVKNEPTRPTTIIRPQLRRAADVIGDSSDVIESTPGMIELRVEGHLLNGDRTPKIITVIEFQQAITTLEKLRPKLKPGEQTERYEKFYNFLLTHRPLSQATNWQPM
jgi:hypothetical protein